MFSAFAVFWPTFSFFGILFYVLRSIGVYKMALNTGMPSPWMAWVPLLHEYLCVKMGDRTLSARGKTPYVEKGFVSLAVIYIVLSLPRALFFRVFLVGMVFRLAFWGVGIAVFVMKIIGEYWLYSDFEPNLATLYTVLSVIGLGSVVKFILRNNVPVGVAGFTSERQPKYQV